MYTNPFYVFTYLGRHCILINMEILEVESYVQSVVIYISNTIRALPQREPVSDQSKGASRLCEALMETSHQSRDVGVARTPAKPKCPSRRVTPPKKEGSCHRSQTSK